jgi:hypothetical protein
MNLTPLTELDVVNNMLLSIGQSPVNTLVVPGVKDVSIAQLTLHNTSREVQTKGWWFNTDTEFPLMPDINGYVPLPPNVLEFSPSNRSQQLSDRAGRLYDRAKRSFTFPTGSPIKCDIKWFLAFTDLPQSARNYIGYKAARKFQTNIVASQLLYQFTKEGELESLAEVERNQLRVLKLNWFNAPVSTNNIFHRR